VPSWHVVG